MTPLKAIRARCLDCSGSSANEVRYCPCTECTLYQFRMNKTPNIQETRKITALKAIRAYCLSCCCGSANEVKLCPCTDCALYPFRSGKNPNIKISPERKKQLADNLKGNSKK